jgi:hypothetical protein
MSKSDRALRIILRIVGVSALLALVAVVMPFSSMAKIHHWLGLGDMPDKLIVNYLARTASGLYAFLGALFLMLATDIARYRPLVRFLGLAFVVIGVTVTVIDLAVGMPLWWTCIEGPPGVPLGLLVFWLAGRESK